jgi:hypothetical protein
MWRVLRRLLRPREGLRTLGSALCSSRTARRERFRYPQTATRTCAGTTSRSLGGSRVSNEKLRRARAMTSRTLSAHS